MLFIDIPDLLLKVKYQSFSSQTGKKNPKFISGIIFFFFKSQGYLRLSCNSSVYPEGQLRFLP